MTSSRPQRLGALDLMRGATVAAMIVVNNPGNWNAVFPQLTHAAWNGVTLADLIFPAFIFIMGVAMSLARPSRGAGDAAQYRQIAVRGLTLVAMGLVLNFVSAWPDVWSMRVPGVLQRIGVTYVVAAIVIANTTGAQQWGAAGGALLLHWAVLLLGESLEPGRNIGATVDRLVFGPHLLTPSGDPEGILGLLTCVATALAGAAAGRSIRQVAQEADAGRQARAQLARGGLVALGAGWAWSLLLPMNKALWTASFAVFSSGASALALAACLWVVPGRGPRATAPLFWLGTNPLAVYFFSELTTTVVQRPWFIVNGQAVAAKDLLYWRLIVPLVRDNGGEWSSLAYAVGYALLWVGVAGAMRWRGVRLRV